MRFRNIISANIFCRNFNIQYENYIYQHKSLSIYLPIPRLPPFFLLLKPQNESHEKTYSASVGFTHRI